MNRTSLCIKMLMLLKSRGKMSTQDIANELETNPRNVREFRNELIVAGFNIKETRGRYGGYELDEDCLFPTLRLTDEEMKAIDESRHFVDSHKEYPLLKDYYSGIDKIMQTTKDRNRSNDMYMDSPGILLSDQEISFYNVIKKGIDINTCIEITYQGAKDEVASTYLVDPYEIIHYHSAYYFIGFSHKRNDYRIYRISQERLFDCKLTERKFLRDSNYHLEYYIGKHSIIKGNFIRVTLKVDSSKIRMVKETYWGMDFTEEKHDTYSIISFLVEDVLSMYRQIYSFGNAIEILEPQSCRDSYVQSIQSILNNYSK